MANRRGTKRLDARTGRWLEVSTMEYHSSTRCICGGFPPDKDPGLGLKYRWSTAQQRQNLKLGLKRK